VLDPRAILLSITNTFNVYMPVKGTRLQQATFSSDP
jgi:hypothetical protein